MSKVKDSELKKPQAKDRATKKNSRKPEQPPLIPEKYQTLSALGGLGVLVLLFFWPVLLGGKVFQAADNSASISFDAFIKQGQEQGIFPLWVPYIFSGMPSFGSLMMAGDRWYDLVIKIYYDGFCKVLGVFFGGSPATYVVWHYFVFGSGVYLLLRQKNISKYAAFISAVGVAFATGYLVWAAVGHNTKIVAFAFVPYIYLMVEKLSEKVSLLRFALLAALLHLQFQTAHVQMIFYSYLALGIYFLFSLVSAIRLRLEDAAGLKRWAFAVGTFAAAAAVAIAMSADTYLSALEYNPSSIRGSTSITEKFEKPSSVLSTPAKKSGQGLDYDYATSWSFAPSEVMTFFAPSFYGFANETYWGPQPFTQAPNFFGTTILILSIIGAAYFCKDKFVGSLIAVGTVSLLLSFGKYFPPAFDLMFYYFPFFNKFRAPSTILALVELVAAILAGYGIKALYELAKNGVSEKEEKVFQWLAIGFGGLLVVSVVGLSSWKDGYIADFAKSDKGRMILRQAGEQGMQAVSYYGEQAFGLMKTDLTISVFIAAILLGLVYAFVKGIVTKQVFQLVLLPLVLIDLGRVAYKPFTFQDRTEHNQDFAATDFTDFMQADKSKFRILSLTQDREANWYAAFKLENANGYSGVKMRLYQDLIEVVGKGSAENFFSNKTLLQLLNIKYLVLDKPYAVPECHETFNGTKYIVTPDGYMPRAFFVRGLKKATDVQIIRNIDAQNFDVKETAFVETDVAGIEPPDSTAKVDAMSVGRLHEIDINVTASGKNFLVVSEIYYPKGWSATIDNVPVETYKTNYAFRGLVVPKGQHKIVFTFASPAYEIGKKISLAANASVLLVLGFSAMLIIRRRKATTQEPPRQA
jgi:hypothetical protein